MATEEEVARLLKILVMAELEDLNMTTARVGLVWKWRHREEGVFRQAQLVGKALPGSMKAQCLGPSKMPTKTHPIILLAKRERSARTMDIKAPFGMAASGREGHG